MPINPRDTLEIPHYGTIAAGTTVDFFNYTGIKQIPRPMWPHREDDLLMVSVCGESMIDENIKDGDQLVCLRLYETSQLKPGNMVVAVLPDGRPAVKRIFFEDHKIILRSSNPRHPDQKYDPQEISVAALVKQVVRDID